MPVSTASSSSKAFLPSPDRKPLYPASFCAQVWSRAYESYARAWDFFLDVSNLSPGQMRYLIACNDPDWSVIRDFIHQLDRWATQSFKVRPDWDYWASCCKTPTLTLSSLLQVKKNLGSIRLRDYLTARISMLQ